MLWAPGLAVLSERSLAAEGDGLFVAGADPGFSLGRGSRSKRRPHAQVAPLFRLRRPLAYGVAYRYLLRGTPQITIAFLDQDKE